MVYCGQMVEGEMFPSSQYKRLIISKNRRLVKGGAAVFCPFLEKIPLPPSVREAGGFLHRLLPLSFRGAPQGYLLRGAKRRGNPRSFSCKFAEKRKNCAIWEQIATPVCGLARNDRLFRQPGLPPGGPHAARLVFFIHSSAAYSVTSASNTWSPRCTVSTMLSPTMWRPRRSSSSHVSCTSVPSAARITSPGSSPASAAP